MLTLSLCALLAAPADDKAGALAYIDRCKLADGTYVATPSAETPKTGSLRATLAGVRASRYLGRKVEPTPALMKFLADCHDADSGGYADAPGGKPDVPTTAVALMLAREFEADTKPVAGSAVKFLTANVKNYEDARIAVAGIEALGEAREVLGDTQSAWVALLPADRVEGRWIADARTLGGVLAAMGRLGVTYTDRADIEGAFAALKAGQNPDGGFGKAVGGPSDLETTYRVMRAFHRYRQTPKDPAALRGFVAKCRNADGGYGVEPGKPSALSPVYYAAIVSHWLGE